MGELEHIKNSELVESTAHSMMHGIVPAEGCIYEWSLFPSTARARQCTHCSFRVVDTANMPEEEMLALLSVHGYEPGDKLYRREDGRFVLGDCLKQRMGNMTTAAVFFLTPVGSYLIFCHPTALVLLDASFYALGVPLLLFLSLGTWLTLRTRSPTLCGVIFACFVLPALIGVFCIPH